MTGDIITGESNIIYGWIEYFQVLLNIEEEDVQIAQESQEQTEETSHSEMTEDITMEELETALRMTKNNKVPGPEMIPFEMIKAGGVPMKDMLLDLFNHAGRAGLVPKEWN